MDLLALSLQIITKVGFGFEKIEWVTWRSLYHVLVILYCRSLLLCLVFMMLRFLAFSSSEWTVGGRGVRDSLENSD